MTMTDERLAELDAVYTKPLHINFSPEWVKAIGDARREIHKAYPDLRAHIEAQAATIARLQEAHETVCEIWGNQERGDLYLDWEDAADDMHNTSVAALTGAA